MAEAIGAGQPIEAITLDRGRIERAQAPTRARALRRVGPRPPLEHVDGPDARVVEIVRGLAERIASRPLTSAMLAIGVGFVVGGALSFRTGRMAVAAAGRHILRELLKQVL